MKVRMFAALAALAAGMSVSGANVAHAQIDQQCQAGSTQDACQKTLDLFKFLAPQLGTLVAGGNATLGQGGTLGGFPHFRVGFRANIVNGSLPQIDDITPSVTGAQSDAYETKAQILPLPQVDAAIGLFKGLPVGVTNVGGVDLLLSGAYLPSFDGSSINVKAGSFRVGYGARVGIVQESMLLPGVSFTVLRRDLPTVDVTATSGNDSLFINGFKVKTTAWRVVASKSLLMFGLAAGMGQDRYNSDVSLRTYVGARTIPPVPATSAGPFLASQELTRTTMFVDLSMNLPGIKFVGEIGRASGGSVSTYNTFTGSSADEARTYGSLGLRLGF